MPRNQGRKAQKAIKTAAADWSIPVDVMQAFFDSQTDLDQGEDAIFSGSEQPTEDNLERMRDAGLWSDSEPELHHDELSQRLYDAITAVDRTEVAGQFIAGLSRPRPDLRSTLMSYAVHHRYEPHAFGDAHPDSQTMQSCKHCPWWSTRKSHKPGYNSLDPTGLRFLRLRLGGGINHANPGYALVDLTDFGRFALLDVTDEDRDVLRTLLDRFRELPETAKRPDLVKATQGIVPGNKNVRLMVVEAFGYLGVLQPKAIPPVWELPFMQIDEDALGLKQNREWRWPVNAWQGTDGVTEEAVQFWFGDV